MRTLTSLTALLNLVLGIAIAAPVSRVTNFQDGNVLYSADLNNEFNNLISGINSITDAQISSSANLSPTKLSSTLAGTAISRSPTTGTLSVAVDGASIVTTGNQLQVGPNGVTVGMIAPISVGSAQLQSGIIRDQYIALQGISTGSIATQSISSALLQDHIIRDQYIALGGVSTQSIAAGAVQNSLLATGAVTVDKAAARIVVSTASLGQVAQSQSPVIGFATTSTTPVAITSLSTILTTGGNPVVIGLRNDSAIGTGSITLVNNSSLTCLSAPQFVRDGTGIVSDALNAGTLSYDDSGTPSTILYTAYFTPEISHLDFPGAGQHTYTMKVSVNSANCTFTMTNLYLYAYEIY